MGGILGVLFAILIILTVAAAVILFRKNRSEKSYRLKNKIGGIISACMSVIFLIMFIFIPFGYTQIQTGEIAVVKVWGEAKEIKSAGLYFRNIVSTKYEIYDIKTQQMTIENEVYTKDAQPLKIELTIQYSLQADKAIQVNTTYGDMKMLAEKIEKIAVEKAKVVLSADTAMGLIETRATISPKLYTEVKTLETQYFVNIENVVIVDMAFSDAFESAVEQKMIAQQEVIKAEAEKEKAIIKAEQDLAVAKLDAEQALARAKGEADAQIEVAKAEAKALKLKSIEVARMLGFAINEIIDENSIDYEIDFANSDPALDKTLISEYLKYIAYLETWDGKLPDVVMDGSGSIIVSP